MLKVSLDESGLMRNVFIDDCFQFSVNLDDSEELDNLNRVTIINDFMNSFKELKVILDEYLERGLNFESLSNERFKYDVIAPLMQMAQKITESNTKKSLFILLELSSVK